MSSHPITVEPVRLETAKTHGSAAALPEFTRLPASGERCPITGLSRSALNALILGPNPPVRSACLRRKGATRGIRLIVTSSLMEYIRSNIDTMPDGQGGAAR